MRRRISLIILILMSSKPLFAQTDYMFVLESGSNISISIFQTLAAALITDVDTVSVVSFSDRADYLFSPLSGNTPELIKLASEKILSYPLRGQVTTAGITAALTTANEQAEAWGRSGVSRKLIIVTSSLSTGKAANISKPDVFDNVHYISIDAPLEQALTDISSDTADNKNAWAVDTKSTTPLNPDFLTFSDGLFTCIDVIVPNRYRKAAVSHDFFSFSAGNFLRQIRDAVILIQNTSSSDKVTLSKSGSNIPVPELPWSDYSVLQLESASMGTYEVNNGEIVLALVRGELSFIVFVVLGVVGVVVLVIILAIIVAGIKRGIITKKPVYMVSYQKSGKDSGRPKVYISRKRDRKREDSFESGVSVKKINDFMQIRDKLDLKIVCDAYPRIVYKAESDTWWVEYNPESSLPTVEEAAVSAVIPVVDDWNIDSASGSSSQKYDADDENYEEPPPQDDKITGNVYKIKRVFEIDSENKLVLTKILN